MKLSEMNTEQFVRFVSKAATPVSNIAGDVEISKAIVEFGKSVPKGTPILVAITKAIDLFIPNIFGKHAEDMYQIVGALTDKSASQVKKQNGLQTIKEFKECFDQELIGFFTQSVK